MPSPSTCPTSHNLVFIATENDTVYAFDADNLATPLWQVTLANPADGATRSPRATPTVSSSCRK
jgi:hypothetical protein